ncbi:hypothetical protein PO878_15620 [Iamia majanohamensis]|uniref:Uncharacterized protein n=1 Tax=Iamia majanohamensis TaxID=467976 RepID=A0AAF0BR33_9ACTN|nr:hypothetical protein [Iamia majanohamensis]WCO65931.1 hypothetical protein PO878_15620 [Iamia majanohamensis]
MASDDETLPPTDEVEEPPPDDTVLDRARHTGAGLDDETIVGHDEPEIVEDPDPDADPGAVT